MPSTGLPRSGVRTPIKANPVYKRDSIERSSKGNRMEDQRVSVCTVCRHGIFKFHNYIWTSNGLIHVTCEETKSDETKNST
jgi:hypothetical protein